MEYIFTTVDEAWQFWFDELSSQSDLHSSRDGEVAGEVLNAISIIEDPTRNLVTSNDRNLSTRYAIGELLWYLSGSNKLKDISRFSSAWKGLSDDNVTINSAYGNRIFSKFGFDQWEHVKALLTNDPNSRQAVIHIKDASNEKTKDLPCTICLQFFIRSKPKPKNVKLAHPEEYKPKLHMTTYMRSNDIWLGFPYDVFTFTCLQIKLAFELGIEIGTYTHISGSLHLYERNKANKANEANEGVHTPVATPNLEKTAFERG